MASVSRLVWDAEAAPAAPAARAAKASGTKLRLSAVPHSLARLPRLTHAGSAFTIEQPDLR
ncbi:hypothetical protein ACWD01_33095 [Streptomyces sp. NPDC002835]